MRLWHKDLLPYLPDAQFKGQLRELVAIMHDWRDKGKTNHLLINRVMEYGKEEFLTYFLKYNSFYIERYGKSVGEKCITEFIDFHNTSKAKWKTIPVFEDWHNKEYLRICMANLFEKYFYAKGKSRITDEEWARLCEGYKSITSEEYVI